MRAHTTIRFLARSLIASSPDAERERAARLNGLANSIGWPIDRRHKQVARRTSSEQRAATLALTAANKSRADNARSTS